MADLFQTTLNSTELKNLPLTYVHNMLYYPSYPFYYMTIGFELHRRYLN